MPSCPNCGSNIPPDKSFCEDCGTGLSNMTGYPSGQMPPASGGQISLVLNNMKTYYLISAIGNGIFFLIGSITVLLTGLSTCGLGCVLGLFPIINIAVMIMDIIAMQKLGERPSRDVYSYLKVTSIFDIVACFALIPLIMGVLNLQNLGKPEVYEYFHEKG